VRTVHAARHAAWAWSALTCIALSCLLLAACSARRLPATGPSASPPAEEIRVVACPTSYGLTQHPLPEYPATLQAALPARTARQVAYYTNSTRSVEPILAPAGWACSASIGADGSTSITVFPRGSSVTSSQQVTAHDDSACQGCIYFSACPLVPHVSADLHETYPGCTMHPARETVTFLSGSPAVTTAGSDIIAYTDPPGVKGDGTASGGPNYARGILLFSWGAVPGQGDRASAMTCTLPATRLRLCQAALTSFRQQNWPQG